MDGLDAAAAAEALASIREPGVAAILLGCIMALGLMAVT